jgi:hypothetical protein
MNSDHRPEHCANARSQSHGQSPPEGHARGGAQDVRAAKSVAEVLHDHFVKEEAYALPPLGLLKVLSEGKFEPEMAEVLTMTTSLRPN